MELQGAFVRCQTLKYKQRFQAMNSSNDFKQKTHNPLKIAEKTRFKMAEFDSFNTEIRRIFVKNERRNALNGAQKESFSLVFEQKTSISR